MGIALLSYRSLPPWGRWTASAVDRILSYIVDLRRISSLFFTPLSPSNLRPFGAPPSIGRKEGVSTRAPSLGRGCRAQRGGVGFLFWRRSGTLANDALETIFFALFHPARTLSGSLRSPPSSRGEGFAGGNGILVSSSIPRKNDRLLRAVVFMCITCLRKRRLNHRIRFNQRFPRTPPPSSSPYRRRSKGNGRGSGHTP